MKLYHGSITPNIQEFEPRTPQFPEEILGVPESEKQTGIYLANSMEMALAMGIRAQGETRVDIENKTIELENPETFKPDQVIYIYEFDVSSIESSNIEYLEDGWQYVVKDTTLKPKRVVPIPSKDIKKYFETKNF